MNTARLHVDRHELKYYLSYQDYEYARSLLRELMDRDEHSPERGYPIRSLYFDDIAESSVEEKLDGIEFRDKYRLRTYDPALPWVKLERKRKDNNYVRKTSVTLTKAEAIALINGDTSCLLQKETADARSLYYDFTKKYLRPVVVVDYVREAYTLPYNNIRVTFDTKLAASQHDLDMFNPELVTIPLQRDDVIIMEVKYDIALPSWFQTCFHLESATTSAISKYAQARIGQMDSWWGLENY